MSYQMFSFKKDFNSYLNGILSYNKTFQPSLDSRKLLR